MARPKKPIDELKDQRVPIMMSEEELRAVDDWRFANRLSSRGEAIRRLCQIGLIVGSKDMLAGPSVELLELAERVIFETERDQSTPEGVKKWASALAAVARLFVDDTLLAGAKIESFRSGESVEDVMKSMPNFSDEFYTAVGVSKRKEFRALVDSALDEVARVIRKT